MNNRKIFQLVLLLCMTGTAIAQQQVSLQEARMAAVNFTTERMGLRTPVEVDTVFVDRNSSEQPLLYEVVLANGEAVLLSASKACTPILGYGYSASGETILNHPNSLPEGLNDFLTSYRAQVADCLSNRNVALSYSGTWDSLQNIFTVPGIRNRNSVGPLLTTKWGQSYSNDSLDANAYNFYAPNSNGNCGTNNCLAGCVAVAMGQVMNYWKHPLIDSLNHTFDWCSMTDVLEEDMEDYEIKRYTISKLLFMCGAAANMQWCMDNGCASGTGPSNIIFALNRFWYIPQGYLQANYAHNPNGWIQILKDEINQYRPIIYCANSTHENIAHAMVCDGFAGNNMFHFNWGMNGYWNGFFMISNLYMGTHIFNASHFAITLRVRGGTEMNHCFQNVSLGDYYETFYSFDDNAELPPFEYVPTYAYDLSSASEYYEPEWRTIPEGHFALYNAHKAVNLKHGFHAERGSSLWIHISECPDCESNRQANMQGTYGNVSDNNEQNGTDQLLFSNKSNYLFLEDFNRSVTLSPNPSTGLLVIDHKEPIFSINIYDIRGDKVTSFKVVSSDEKCTMIDATSIRSGVYLLKLTDKDGRKHLFKFLKM